MAGVLSDPDLYAFTGGEPVSADALGDRYRRQLAGPEDPGVFWLNWVISSPADRCLVGYLHASIVNDGRLAEVAWVVGTDWQGQGFAKEAAGALVGWLRDRGVVTVIAHVHPEHAASASVAAAAGLIRTDPAAGRRAPVATGCRRMMSADGSAPIRGAPQWAHCSGCADSGALTAVR